MRTARSVVATLILAVVATANWTSEHPQLQAQAPTPKLRDRNLAVRPAASGLITPISLAFLGPGDMLVLEKNTGKVQRIVNGTLHSTVLDLAVNSASERGLLGIALHPKFPANPGVYLYWSCVAPPPLEGNPFFPSAERCSDPPQTGADSNNILAVPLLGNRVDRFIWTGSALVFHHNLIMLRAFQHDAAPDPPGQNDGAQPPRGNHDGGVLRFGPDGKLYILIGDVGRRGQLQNLPDGPGGLTRADDQFGGPEPDDAHLTGVILRLNDDGRTPPDNPLRAPQGMGPQAVANVRKIFAYGLRNSFGMDFDPVSRMLWHEQNGDDSFTEINLTEPGVNLGWIQVMGPISRVAQFRAIETSNNVDPVSLTPYFGLQQERWLPTNIAGTPAEARARLFMLPGAHYSDPEFSWRFEAAPGGLAFLRSGALGPQYQNDMFVGAARTFPPPTPTAPICSSSRGAPCALTDGFLWRFNLTGNRRRIAVDDPRLADRVADNTFKFDLTESESLLFGTGFGVGTDIQTGPNGNLFVVSLTHGVVYEIFRKR
jgi:aldose sugar dehydrogenase